MFNYFKIDGELTIDNIKKQYKKLAFMYHPDLHQNELEKYAAIMKEINLEYEKALKEVGKQNNKNYSFDIEFVDIIDALIKLRMQNVTIEVCGWFVYVAGDTKPYKDYLKALKLYWNSAKAAWYYKPAWYTKKGKEVWSMDRIRNTWGSQYVNNRQEKAEQELITA